MALFWPIEARHEVDLRTLDASLRDRGVTVAYPSVDDETRLMVTFRVVADVSLLRRTWAWASPSRLGRLGPCCGRGELDVIIVPRRSRIDPCVVTASATAPGSTTAPLPDLVPTADHRSGSPTITSWSPTFRTRRETYAVDWIVTDTRARCAAER